MMQSMLDIRAIGLALPAEGGRAEAITAILNEQAQSCRHPHFIGHDGAAQVGCFVSACQDERDTARRLAQLLAMAFADGLAQRPADIPEDAPMTLYLTLPGWLQRAPEVQGAFLDAVRGMNFPHVAQVRYFYGAQPAGFEALAMAAADLETAPPGTYALVAAVDTLVSPLVLDMRALMGLSIIKGNPYGAIPSEGAALVLVQRMGAARTPPLGRVRDIAGGIEAEKLPDRDRGILGRALLECLRSVDEALGDTDAGLLMSDANGERARAEELGTTLSQIAGPNEALQTPLCPALSIGDIGAATALCYVALACFIRPGGAPHVLIATSDMAGPRAAAVIDVPG